MTNDYKHQLYVRDRRLVPHQSLREQARRLYQVGRGQLSGGASNPGFVTAGARASSVGIHVAPALFDPRKGAAR